MRYCALFGCLFLVSCVSGQYYEPQASWSEVRSIGAPCSGSYKQLRKRLSPGVIVEIGGPWAGPTSIDTFYLHVAFRIEKGHTVRLKSNAVGMYISDNGTTQELQIAAISSGIPDPQYAKLHNLPEIHYEPLAILKGTGRSDHIKMRRGEYSAWYGEGEVFTLEITPIESAPNVVTVSLPQLEVDGVSMTLQSVQFVKTTGQSACVQ